MSIADTLAGEVGMMKIGLQAFVSCGPSIVHEIRDAGHEVFLDLKFHDIPNTAGNAVREASRLGARLTNVHASGGATMLRSAAEAVEGSTQLLGVTVLTSMSDEDLSEIGMAGTAGENALRLASVCKSAGVHGVVASPHEIEAIRHACGSNFLIVTPGIRGVSDPAGDQRRTMSASEAVKAGADWIVVGRPITATSDMRGAARAIIDSI